jgi:hypothetical protein
MKPENGNRSRNEKWLSDPKGIFYMCPKIQVLNCAISTGQRAVVNGSIVVHRPVSSESGRK